MLLAFVLGKLRCPSYSGQFSFSQHAGFEKQQVLTSSFFIISKVLINPASPEDFVYSSTVGSCLDKP